MSKAYERELEFGLALVKRAGEATLRYWRSGLACDTKADASPVTLADREGERLMAAAIEEAYPDDGLLGEEGANKASRSGRRWIIDPIDGTRDFIRGTPFWANFLALEVDGEVAAGFVHLPAMRETYHASVGAGAWSDGCRIHASGATEISQAFLLFESWNEVHKYAWAPKVLEFVRPFWAVRCLGGCYDAMMVARGVADAWIVTGGKPWDFAAVKVIAEEAGARFFDFQGRSTIHGGNAVICAPGLERPLREFVGAPAS